jgi:hypothetical protein
MPMSKERSMRQFLGPGVTFWAITLLLTLSVQPGFGEEPTALTGAYLTPADDFNKVYYGKVVTARAVFERKEVYNRDTSKLVSLVTRNAKARRR